MRKFALTALLVPALLFCKQKPRIEDPCCSGSKGWSLAVGGKYAWTQLTTPPTETGSVGGIEGSISYQVPDSFFGSIRSQYLLGPLSSSLVDASFQEWDSSVVGGYCFSCGGNWRLTPYAGVGFDAIQDHHDGTSSLLPITLKYRIYYALFGFDSRWSQQDWMVALQFECLPTFNQYLKIKTLTGDAWVLSDRVGFAAKVPVGYRYWKQFWVELTPYYRFFPIGSSAVLDLSHRNLSEWGVSLSFRFFL